jgi:hypothetical protein
MSLSAGTTSSGRSVLNEPLSLVEPPIYQPFETAITILRLSPQLLFAVPNRQLESAKIGSSRSTIHVAPSEFENGEKFHWSLPNGRYLAFSGPVCCVEPPRTRGISRVSLQNIRNRGLVWRRGVNSNLRYRPVCRFGGLSPRLSGSGRVASLGPRDRSGRIAGDWRWLRTPQSTYT